MNETIVPDLQTDIVMRFCSSISREQPLALPVLAESYCLKNDCFNNVAKKVSEDGGSIVYGWQVWLWPDILIEAEFHSIWKSPEGVYVDVTPKEGTETLFIPDAKKVYKGHRVDNIRRNISSNKLVDLFIAATESSVRLENHKEHYPPSLDEQYLLYDLTMGRVILMKMIKNGSSNKSPCPCQSGRKYKVCCGRGLLERVNLVKQNYK